MLGPPCDKRLPGGHRAAIIAPTLGDAWEACVTGPSGLQALNPTVQGITTKGGTVVRWPNGAEAKLFGTQNLKDVDRLRAGGNRCAAWLEELAAWPRLDEAWENLDFGLRLGKHPQKVASTTPKVRARIKALLKEAKDGRKVALSRAHTDDNPHLHPNVRAALMATYGGTRLGRQELGGELLEDVEGAIWKLHEIEEDRWRGEWGELESGLLVPKIPRLKKVCVGVDPPGGATECGITVQGLGEDLRAYVLADLSLEAGPAKWAKKAVNGYEDHAADRIIAEKNFGGDMVKHTIHTADPDVPVTVIHAHRGKTLRAEPILAFYQQHRVVHVGTFLEMEEEQTTWVDEPGVPSPNRMDALVHGLTWLLVGNPIKRATGHARQIAAARIDL